jgi:hypothetical protein
MPIDDMKPKPPLIMVRPLLQYKNPEQDVRLDPRLSGTAIALTAAILEPKRSQELPSNRPGLGR